MKTNNQGSTCDIIKKPKVHQKVDLLPVGENEWKVAEVVSKKASMKISCMFVSKMKLSTVRIGRTMFKNGTCMMKNI